MIRDIRDGTHARSRLSISRTQTIYTRLHVPGTIDATYLRKVIKDDFCLAIKIDELLEELDR